MDPYIDTAALDPGSPYHRAKLDNLATCDRAHADLAERVEGLPSKIVVQTTDRCNLDCVMCQLPRGSKRARMDWELFERIADQLLPTLVELHPTNVGEPLCWPWFDRMCEILEHYGVVLDLTTNGTLLRGSHLDHVVPIARDVKVSFDGATAATFERIRRGASFHEVCANICQFATRLTDVELRRPILALQMTLMRSNYRELPALVRLASELGATRVKAYHLFSFDPALDDECLVLDLAAWPEVLALAEELGRELGIELQLAEPERPEPTCDGLAPVACHLPWHESWIDVDGAVLPCHSHGGDSAGSLREQDFSAIWNGALYRRIRGAFRAGRPGWHCGGCGMNLDKAREHDPVPYDPESFLSPAGRTRAGLDEPSPVRWSARMRPFDLTGRR